MEHNAKNKVCKTVISGKEQNLLKKWMNLEFPYFFNTISTFRQNSVVFQGLENRFHNSILFQYRTETPVMISNHVTAMWNIVHEYTVVKKENLDSRYKRLIQNWLRCE